MDPVSARASASGTSSSAGVATSDLAKEASLGALAEAGVTADQLGFIVVGTTTPDTIFPSTACVLQDKLGAHHAWGFDLGAACSGFTYSLTVGMQMVASGAHEHALVVGADVMSSIIDYTDRTTCVLFGDGAGAVVLSTAGADEPHIIDFEHEIDGSGGHALCMPAGGSRLPASHETVDEAAALREAGRADGLQVRGEEDRGDLAAAALPQRTAARATSICSCRTRRTAGSSKPRPSAWGSDPTR